MDLDLDPYGDIFGENLGKNTTRTGGKFQPKAKRGPTKKGLTFHSSHSVNNQDMVDLPNKDPLVPHDKDVIGSVPESDVPLTNIEEDVPDISPAEDPLIHGQTTISKKEISEGRILRPRKNLQKSEVIDDEEEEEKAYSSEEDNNSEEEAKKRRKKSKKVDETEKQSTPKKFSHRTRIKKRIVDKVLLQTPEDEIDFQRVPLRDLLVLADYKERISKKEGSTSNNVGTSSREFHRDEVFDFGFNEEEDNNDNDEVAIEEDLTCYSNYQTYMNKTESKRWSKEDTQLFYEALQQFGTDLSMIQQLFPERTHRQIKMKYKKEERQYPFRLHEALTNRPIGHSHFDTIIKRLHQIAAQKTKEMNEDDQLDEEEEDEDILPHQTQNEILNSSDYKN